jgi:hypothetical protein
MDFYAINDEDKVIEMPSDDVKNQEIIPEKIFSIRVIRIPYSIHNDQYQHRTIKSKSPIRKRSSDIFEFE